MKDKEGAIQIAWKEITNIIRRHFIKLFGTEEAVDKDAINKILEAQTTKISLESRELLDKDITLEELHYVGGQLAKEKVSGRNGIPVEFYLIL